MKHIVKILSIMVAIAAFWIGLLHTSIVPQSQTWLLPLYLIISLACYGLLMVGIGLMRFPTCPQEAVLLQQLGEDYNKYNKKIYGGVVKGKRKNPAVWAAPPSGLIKVNCDASLKDGNWVVLAAVARDHLVRLAHKYGIKDLILESDNRIIISQFFKGSIFLSDLDNVLEDVLDDVIEAKDFLRQKGVDIGSD